MVRVQTLATPRDLDDFGPAPDALASLPLTRKLRVLRSVSGHVLTYVRKRGAPPLVVTVEDATATLTAGATWTQAGAPGNALDVVIRFPVDGTVGVPGLTFEVSVNGGASFAAPVTLPLSGSITIDNLTTTFAGDLAADDALAYATQVEEEIRLHVVAICAWYLLRNRGLDPAVEQELKASYDAAQAWLKDLIAGDAELDGVADQTALEDEHGPLASRRILPWAWLGTAEDS